MASSSGSVSGSFEASVSSSTYSTTPQILSRSAFPQLLANLDASDVLECYRLTRQAPLHFPLVSSQNKNNNNATLTTTKLAIGLRYHPKSSTAPRQKKPLEFTLEYGPTRFGLQQDQEAVPHLLVSTTSGSSSGSTTHEETAAGFVTYENEAQVYYTTRIQPESWKSAIYMASLTGAVLPSLLEQALRYPTLHPRYQPFAVYQILEKENHVEEEDGGERNRKNKRHEEESSSQWQQSQSSTRAQQLVLKSSTSSDFLQHLWQFLARVGVELQPILTPPVHQAQLYVHHIEKVSGVDEEMQSLVSTRAWKFYSKLQKCVLALGTGDYTEYAPTGSPTVSNAPSGLATVSTRPTISSSTLDEPEGADETDDGGEQPTDAVSSSAPTATPSHDGRWQRRRERRRQQQTPIEEEEGEMALIPDNLEETHADETGAETDRSSTVNPSVPSTMPSSIPNIDAAPVTADTDNNSLVPSISFTPSIAPSESKGDEAAQAQQAADKAKEAAAEAKNAAQSDADSKAANAAEAAANAAQKAADATSAKTSQQAMESLFSGDGDAMSEVLTQCITSPQYDIDASEVYLYLDGAFYYKLNMTAPYLDVVRIDREIPRTPSLTSSTGGDIVDWTLALALFALVGMCFLATCQQMGFPIISPMYKLQRWFFSPRHYDEDEVDKRKGQGFEHAFGEDVIPLSMGGRRPLHEDTPGHLVMPADDHDDLFEETSDHIDVPGSDTSGPLVIELPDLSLSKSRRDSSSANIPLDRSDSHHSRRESSGMLEVPERFSRDPDLVDLPNLVSRSKVAVPVGQPSQGDSSGTDEDEEDSLRNDIGIFD